MIEKNKFNEIRTSLPYCLYRVDGRFFVLDNNGTKIRFVKVETQPNRRTEKSVGMEIIRDRWGVDAHSDAIIMTKEKFKDLDDAEKYRKEFIGNVSHELKTPIFAAQGFVHTLLDGAVNDKNVRNKFLKKAAKSLDGLDILVQDLLTLSQIETGDIKMRFEHIDLYKLCVEVVDQFEEKAEKKNIKLKRLKF